MSSTPSDGELALIRWDELVNDLEATLTTSAPLEGLLDGGMTSAAEHGRSALLSAIREEIRLAKSNMQLAKAVTEAQLDSMARCDPRYLTNLSETLEMKTQRAELTAQQIVLEHRIGRIKALVYRDGKLAGAL